MGPGWEEGNGGGAGGSWMARGLEGREPNLMNDQVIRQQHSPESPKEHTCAPHPLNRNAGQSERSLRVSRMAFDLHSSHWWKAGTTHLHTFPQIQILIITYSMENMMVSKFIYTCYYILIFTLACHVSKCFTFDTRVGWHLSIFMMPWGNSFVHISNKYILYRLFTLITPELMCLLYPVLIELRSELRISRLTGHRGCDSPSYPFLLWCADLFFKACCCDCTPSSSQQVVLNSVKLTSTKNGSKYCAILVIFKAMLNCQEGHYRITSDAVP